MSADKAEFHWELLKLLLQVAWADDDVGEGERRLVLGLAERLGLADARRAELSALLEQGASLPPPDMQLLRSRKRDALEAAEQLVLADGEIADDENQVLAELTALLGGADPEGGAGSG